MCTGVMSQGRCSLICNIIHEKQTKHSAVVTCVAACLLEHARERERERESEGGREGGRVGCLTLTRDSIATGSLYCCAL
jgi:hypothetical protein